MERYTDRDNDSGILAYEIGTDRITVQFKQGRHSIYTYTYASAGSANIEYMKRLAMNGDGLNEFINEKKMPYASKY